MTYFGMWKSFFSWHLEDRDLYSINYLHFGEPKIWYSVSPHDKPKFDRMAQSVFPDLHKSCKAFMRHKDVMLSPAQLRSFNVPYVMVGRCCCCCCCCCCCWPGIHCTPLCGAHHASAAAWPGIATAQASSPAAVAAVQPHAMPAAAHSTLHCHCAPVW
jgi:hypothetical protein